MKKSTRLISVLLAMILCLSCTSVGVFAEYADYSSPAGMNALDHPYISAYQCGSMLLDRVDELLEQPASVPIRNMARSMATKTAIVRFVRSGP